MRTLLICAVVGLLFGFQSAHAQLDLSGLQNPELIIELKPSYPRPGEEVTATLNDYRGGTYGSSITWVFDGQVIPDAANRRSAKFTAGKAGSTQRIEAVLQKPQGGKEVLVAVIRPIYLDIIIEPQTRVPQFYPGRSLPSVGSVVNATALVSSESFLTTDLVYTWRVNQKVLEGGPVRGRNQVSFQTPMGDNAILSLQVTDTKGVVLSRRSIFVPSVRPSMHFYEVNSLFGINPIALSRESLLVGNSLTVRAEPYNLDTRVFNDPSVSQWEINSRAVNNQGSNPYEITIQRTGSSGSSKLNYHVRDTTQVLQGVEKSIQINF